MEAKRVVLLCFAGACLVVSYLLDMWLLGLLIALGCAAVALFAPLPEE